MKKWFSLFKNGAKEKMKRILNPIQTFSFAILSISENFFRVYWRPLLFAFSVLYLFSVTWEQMCVSNKTVDTNVIFRTGNMIFNPPK